MRVLLTPRKWVQIKPSRRHAEARVGPESDRHTGPESDCHRHGLPLDMFSFTMMQELMAGELGVGMGRYIHSVGSLHVYDNDDMDIDDFLAEGWQSTDTPMPAMPAQSLTRHVPQFLEAEQQIRGGTTFANLALPSDPYWADLARMLALESARSRDATEEVAAVKASIAAPFYSEFLRRD